jgi:hypothetical protein
MDFSFLTDIGNFATNTAKNVGTTVTDGLGITGNDSWFDNKGASGKFFNMTPVSKNNSQYSLFSQKGLADSLGGTIDFLNSDKGTAFLKNANSLYSGYNNYRANKDQRALTKANIANMNLAMHNADRASDFAYDQATTASNSLTNSSNDQIKKKQRQTYIPNNTYSLGV